MTLNQLILDDASIEEISAALGGGADLNAGERVNGIDGVTPIMNALMAGHEDIAMFLIRKGADVHARTGDGDTALHIAAHYGHTRALAELINAKADVNARGRWLQTPIHEAVADGIDKDTVELLLGAGANINARDKHGRGALDYLYGLAANVAANVAEDIAFLVERGADPNAPGRFGRKPLTEAIYTGSLDRVRALLEGGADVHGVDKRGRNPLHLASTPKLYQSPDDIAILELLIAAGAGINATDQQGRIPLDMALFSGWVTEGEDLGALHVDALLRHGASFERKDRWGCCARLTSAVLGAPAALEVIVACQEKLGLDDALSHAISVGHDALEDIKIRNDHHRFARSINVLLASGAPAEALYPILERSYDQSTFSFMTSAERSEILSALLDAGMDLGERTESGDTRLHWLCRNAPSKDIKTIADACGRGAINLRDEQGDTPLHAYLKFHSNPASISVKHLLGAGAEVSLTDGDGMDVVEIIRSREDGRLCMERLLPGLEDYGYESPAQAAPAETVPAAAVGEGPQV